MKRSVCTLSNVEGLVQYRTDPDGRWIVLPPGKAIEVPAEAEVRNGPKSSFTIIVTGLDGRIEQTLCKALGVCGVDSVVRKIAIGENPSLIENQPGPMKPVEKYAIEAAGLDVDLTIRSPGAAFAVRG